VLHACRWGIGGNLTGDAREGFDAFVREALQPVANFPGSGVVYDYQLMPAPKTSHGGMSNPAPVFRLWADSVPTYAAPKGAVTSQVAGGGGKLEGGWDEGHAAGGGLECGVLGP